MQVRQAFRVEDYGADDAEAVDAGRRVLNAGQATDAPAMPPVTAFRREMEVRYGWESKPERHLLMRVDDVPVAMADVELGEWDNLDLAWIHLVVDPAHRRQGHGSKLLAQVEQLVRDHGCTKLVVHGWETPASVPFATRHGLSLASQEICRVQDPQALPPGFAQAAYAEAAAHAEDYELVRVEGHAPDHLLPALSELAAAINDAPMDDLELDTEVFPVERIRRFENATIAAGHRLYRVVARHRATGEAAGHTVVAVDTERPELAEQDDTSVVRAHRGHRLGLLLKSEMLRWLSEAEPQVTALETWNAESNHHMIAINERLGYRPVGRVLEFQRRC